MPLSYHFILHFMRIEALGESGLLLKDLGGLPAWRVARSLREAGLPGMIEAAAAYETVGLYFRSEPCPLAEIEEALNGLAASSGQPRATHSIPVCYEMGEDLPGAAGQLGMTAEVLIALHLSTTYDCHAVGFCPGFAYLGYLPEAISGLPRLPSPRARVEPGSVGITGRQTAVYPMATPGGWWLIGRTPIELVNLEEGYFPIEAGDQVRFRRIDLIEFERLRGERL